MVPRGQTETRRGEGTSGQTRTRAFYYTHFLSVCVCMYYFEPQILGGVFPKSGTCSHRTTVQWGLNGDPQACSGLPSVPVMSCTQKTTSLDDILKNGLGILENAPQCGHSNLTSGIWARTTPEELCPSVQRSWSP